MDVGPGELQGARLATRVRRERQGGGRQRQSQPGGAAAGRDTMRYAVTRKRSVLRLLLAKR